MYSRYEKYARFLQSSGKEVEGARLRLQLETQNRVKLPEIDSVKRMPPSCLAGEWESAYFNSARDYVLKLRLSVRDGSLTGRYFASEGVEIPFFVTQDTLGDTTPSVSGSYRDGVMRATVRSMDGRQNADVTMVRVGKYLVWRLHNWQGPLPAEHRSDPYAIPFEAILKPCQ